MTKEAISELQKNLHQWMTIIGFPVLIGLVGDMYFDFKRFRDNDIRQDEKIVNINSNVERHETAIQALGNFVYRGVK